MSSLFKPSGSNPLCDSSPLGSTLGSEAASDASPSNTGREVIAKASSKPVRSPLGGISGDLASYGAPTYGGRH